MTQRVPFGSLCSLIACLLYLAQGLKDNEYCKMVSTNEEKTDPITLNDQKSSLIQTECVRYYKLDIETRADSDRFLSFEAHISTMPTNEDITPAVVQQVGFMPEISENGKLDNNVAIDYNGYSNIRPDHNIVVDLSSLTFPTTLFFAVYQYAPDKSRMDYHSDQIIYDITTKTSTDYPCRNGCTDPSQGTCDQLYRQCRCNEGFFDVDCSVKGTVLPFDGNAGQKIQPLTWTYFYIPARDYGGSLKLYIDKSQGSLSLSFLFNNALEYYLSNSILSDGKFFFSSDTFEQTLRLPQSGFRLHSGGRLMIGAYTSETDAVNLKLAVSLFDQEGSSRSSIMFIMIGIACGLIILWIAFSIIKYRAYRHAALARRHQSLMLQRSILSKEEIDKYFANKDFGRCTSSFPQTLCSICLDDFQPDTPCRQLYCEHIFHGLCIESWFANHTNCPNCKKPMTREAIEEFIKNPVKSVTSPKSPDIEANTLNANANSSPEAKDLSKDMLNSSIGESRGKQKVDCGIDLDSPPSKTAKHKPGKGEIKINAAETNITSSIKSRDVTRSEIKDHVEEEVQAARNTNQTEGMIEETPISVSQHIDNNKIES